MAHTLPPLPYPVDALEPYIDKMTMEIHHGRHHKAYVDNLNKALEGQASLKDKPVLELLRQINQVPDADSDAMTGKNHLVVTFGKENTPLIYGGILVLAMGVHTYLTLTAPGSTWLWWMPGIVLFGYGAYIVNYMRRHIGSRTLVHANVQTILLDTVYGLVFAGIIALL